MKNQRKMIGVILVLASFILVMKVDSGEKDFPNKPLEYIVPFVAGGSTDIMCRTIAARAAAFLNNQPILVVNKAGAGTVAASRYVLDRKNDGYTIYSTSTSSMMIAPLVHKTDYSWRDFIGIAQIMFEGDAFYVRADVPYNTMEKFIEYAKLNPGKIKYAHSGAGSSPHLAMEGFAAAKGFVIKHIPTKGNVEAIAAIIGGHVVAAAGNPMAFKPHIDAGKIKCLAQFGNERDKVLLPGVPTFKEQGIDVIVDLWRWVVVPKNTPIDRVKVLASTLKNILHEETTAANLKKIGCTVTYLPPEEYEKVMKKSEVAISGLIKAAGL